MGSTVAPSLWVVDGRQGPFMTSEPDRLSLCGLRKNIYKKTKISEFVPDLALETARIV
jgi:hypothetical protein